MNGERNALNAYLKQLPAGQLESTSELETLLSRAWDSLTGSKDGGMRGHKLHSRIEQAHWTPPILSFRIERHGDTVFGSTRAEIQSWEVNTLAWTAVMSLTGHRQLKRMAPRLHVRPVAAEVRDLILNGRKDARLNWLSDQRVRLQIGKIIPDVGYKQTVSGRRKRFKGVLDDMLSGHGWRRVSPNDQPLAGLALGTLGVAQGWDRTRLGRFRKSPCPSVWIMRRMRSSFRMRNGPKAQHQGSPGQRPGNSEQE